MFYNFSPSPPPPPRDQMVGPLYKNSVTVKYICVDVKFLGNQFFRQGWHPTNSGVLYGWFNFQLMNRIQDLPSYFSLVSAHFYTFGQASINIFTITLAKISTKILEFQFEQLGSRRRVNRLALSAVVWPDYYTFHLYTLEVVNVCCCLNLFSLKILILYI